MPIPIPRALVEFILLGPTDDRRQLQDSPILGDVWIAFAEHPAGSIDLLITPHRTQPAGRVAAKIAGRIEREDSDVAYLQAVVAARLRFEEVLRVVVPMTEWWHEERNQKKLETYTRDQTDRAGDSQPGILSVKTIEVSIARVLEAAKAWHTRRHSGQMQYADPLDRYATLAGLILWAKAASSKGKKKTNETAPSIDRISEILRMVTAKGVTKPLANLFEEILASPLDSESLVWQISLNRSATPALTRSVPAVKADAARSLFRVDCSEIGWAVLDSGIEGDHAAFRDASGAKSRVKRSFDFSQFRKVLSLSNSNPKIREKHWKSCSSGRTCSRSRINPAPKILSRHSRKTR